MALVAEQPDLTLNEILDRIGERVVRTSVTSLWRLFDSRGISFEKSLRVSERLRADVALARQAWREGQPALEPGKLVFIDEPSTNTAMTRLSERCKCSQRLIGDRAAKCACRSPIRRLPG